MLELKQYSANGTIQASEKYALSAAPRRLSTITGGRLTAASQHIAPT
ncbi:MULTISPECIES: hypothetical protein [unclassified Kitasatospora]